jgi:hypothetical protein
MEWFGAGRSSLSVRVGAFDRERLTLGNDACTLELTARGSSVCIACF